MPTTPSSLVRSWLDQDLAVPGRRRADAIRDLNAEFNTKFTNSRLNEWLRRDREPAADVRAFMLRCCIQRVLRLHGVSAHKLTDAQLDAIADSLS